VCVCVCVREIECVCVFFVCERVCLLLSLNPYVPTQAAKEVTHYMQTKLA
jgi:hypothetical protein